MANLVRVLSRDDLPPGQGKCVEVAGKSVALFNVDGSFFAIDNTCVHRGGPLGEGALEGGVVTCPWHGWKYDCRTGQSLNAPGRGVHSYPVEVQGKDVLVDVG